MAKGVPMGILKYTRRILVLIGISMISILIFLASFAVKWDQEASDAFSSGLWQLPSSVYARSLEVFAGGSIGRAQIVEELQRLGYTSSSSLSKAGQFQASDSNLEVITREFTHWEGVEPSQRVVMSFKGEVLEEMKTLGGEIVDIVRLEPPVIGHIYPSRKELRQLVKISEVPELLVKGLVAVEDQDFLSHRGVDPKGIARAMWLNLKAGRIVQGGSTLTLQLVKNLC
jgi:penicillin-binding protein 1B